jgi:hypothetical protein
MAIAEYKRLLEDAYDLDKPEAPSQELDFLLEDAGFVSVEATKHSPRSPATATRRWCRSSRSSPSERAALHPLGVGGGEQCG